MPAQNTRVHAVFRLIKPNASFTATGADSGTLTRVASGMQYSLDGGSSWTEISGTSVTIASGVTAANGIKVYQPQPGSSPSEENTQTITVTKAAPPSVYIMEDLVSGQILVTTSNNKPVEYRKSGESNWTEVSVSFNQAQITGLEPGTYEVRVKASGTELASESVSATISVTYRIALNENIYNVVKVPNYAKEGDVVQIRTAMGYSPDIIKSAVCKGADGTDVTVTKNNDGYAFTMPAQAVTVTVEVGVSYNLKRLDVTPGTLTPALSRETTEYTIMVPADVSEISLELESESALSITGNPWKAGTVTETSDGNGNVRSVKGTIELDPGRKVINVETYAANGFPTSVNYTITIIRHTHYTVSYYRLETDTEPIQRFTVTEGATHIVPDLTPDSLQYHSFVGWKYNDVIYTKTNEIQNITSDVNLYAQWMRNVIIYVVDMEHPETKITGANVWLRIRSNGNTVRQWTSGTNAEEVTGLTAGTEYVLRVVDPLPSGYDSLGDEVFRVKADGTAEPVAGSWAAYVDENGDILLRLPKIYQVSYETNGGTINSGNVTQYSYSQSEILPTDVTNGNLRFGGWYADENFTGDPVSVITSTDTGNKVFYAKWDSSYSVEYYYQNNGAYPDTATSSVTRTGTVGTSVSVTDDDKVPTETGYVLDASKNGDWSGTIARDGVPVLKVYFKQQFTVTYKPGEHGTFTEQKTTVDYGAAVPAAPAVSGESGYNFTGWSPAVPSTPVSGNLEFTAQWVAAGDTAYIVEYYYQSNGSYPAAATSSAARTGTTGTEVSVSDADKTPSQPGYALDETKSDAWSGTIAADGSLVLKVYFKQQFTVTWKNLDGTVLETDANVPYGTTPTYDGSTPVRSADAENTYTFSGWDPEIETVTKDVTYTAVFTNTVKTYTVTWKNWDGMVLETDANVPYGTTPTYDGSTPVRSADAENTYTFSGWDPEIETVTKDVTYTAVFTNAAKTYTVTWKNWDGTVLETDANVPYGATPTYDGETPVKAGTDEFTYTFSGWDPEVTAVTKDVTYTARFTSSARTYTVRWENEDGTLLELDESVPYGTIPVYDGSTPKRADDEAFTYTFKGWYPEVTAVSGDATYTAMYNAETKIFRVKVTTDGHGTAKASPESGPKGTVVTLTVLTIHQGYSFKEWQVVSGGVTVTGNTFTLGTEDVEIVAIFEPIPEPEGMKLNVEIINFQNSGAKGVPTDVGAVTVPVRIRIAGNDLESLSEERELKLSGGQVKVKLNAVIFDRELPGLLTPPYEVEMTGLPDTIVGAAPVRQKYTLTTFGWINLEGNATVYLLWDNGKTSGPEKIKVYALPEDEIGAYALRKDGTKEYLLFHTYDICMEWLGSDELCRGYERCFHKER